MQSCQMNLGIRYWDDVKNLVQTQYFDSKFLQHPNAEMLFEKIEAESIFNRVGWKQLNSTFYGWSIC